jgi:dTDP-4-dehydrorhamnose reductase
MRILIAGARGMLGTELATSFGLRHPVTGVDIEELDITSASQSRALIESVRPEVVVNAAALTQVDYCESHPEEAFRVNAEGAGNLAAAAATVGARLVHYSTDYVFDGRREEAYSEEDAPCPLSIYGKSKLRGEEWVRERCPGHLIVRTSWLFGIHGANFIRTILSAARKGLPLRVVRDQRGSPTYTADLAAHTVLMVEARCSGTYHVTNSGSCTWYDLAAAAIELARLPGIAITPVSTSEFPRPAPRPANSVLANARLEREGLPRMRPWKEAVRDYLSRTAGGE